VTHVYHHYNTQPIAQIDNEARDCQERVLSTKIVGIRCYCENIATGAVTNPMPPTATTTIPATYTPTPISDDTYYISTQTFDVVVQFASASANLTASNYTSDPSQQVFIPYSHLMVRGILKPLKVADNSKPSVGGTVPRLRIQECSL